MQHLKDAYSKRSICCLSEIKISQGRLYFCLIYLKTLVTHVWVKGFCCSNHWGIHSRLREG